MTFDPTTTLAIQDLPRESVGFIALAAGTFEIRATNTIHVADDGAFTDPTLVFLGQPARITLGAPATLFFRAVRARTPTDIGVSALVTLPEFDPSLTASIENLPAGASDSVALAAGTFEIRATNTVLVASDAGFTDPTLVFLGQPATVRMPAPGSLFFQAVRARSPTDIAVSTATAPSSVVQRRSIQLASDFTTAVVAPVYTTLLTLPVTTLLASSVLDIAFSCGVRHVGAVLVNVAINVRLRVDGVLQTGGGTQNGVRNRIQPLVCDKPGVPVTAGAHTVVAEISKFGGGANVITIDPVALPDLNYAQLTVEEVSL